MCLPMPILMETQLKYTEELPIQSLVDHLVELLSCILISTSPIQFLEQHTGNVLKLVQLLPDRPYQH